MKPQVRSSLSLCAHVWSPNFGRHTSTSCSRVHARIALPAQHPCKRWVENEMPGAPTCNSTAVPLPLLKGELAVHENAALPSCLWGTRVQRRHWRVIGNMGSSVWPMERWWMSRITSRPWLLKNCWLPAFSSSLSFRCRELSCHRGCQNTADKELWFLSTCTEESHPWPVVHLEISELCQPRLLLQYPELPILTANVSERRQSFEGFSGGDTASCTTSKWSLGMQGGKGNGNPLQYSCLENSMDRGAWWAHGVTQSRTRLKWLSSSSRNA